MLSKNIKFKNFSNISNISKVSSAYRNIKKNYSKKNFNLLVSLSKNYKYSYNYKFVNKYKNFKDYIIIGMGGSILGAKAIYQFLKFKIKKNFFFIDNLISKINIKKKNYVTLIISKSGNTLETISNFNVILKKNKNIIITENQDNYLNNLAKKIKSEIIEHKNFIGGRFSVLSEAGMLPAQLMGLKEAKFKRFNYLINNKEFEKNLVKNVAATLNLIKEKKNLSVILNYDKNSENIFYWYQQLIAESLGKKSKGILPIISLMPRDNHSLMQYYLDGPKKSFFTFFSVLEKNSNKINNKYLLKSCSHLKNKNLNKILDSQIKATKNIFKKRKIPFRSFTILNRSEESLGELFCFFILETILLGRALKVNPFDQPAVELIKKETKKILLRS